MKRVVSLFLPIWPIDRIKRRGLRGERHDDATLIVLTRVDRGRHIVACCCVRSTSRGIHPGMTVAHARALLGGRRVVESDHQPQRDRATLDRLASWAIRFAPLVASDPHRDDGLLLDVTGCERLYADERRLLNAIGNSVERLGITCRLCCADTVGCAWAVARFGATERTVVASGKQEQAIASLPVESLRLDDETVAALREVNIDRVADVLAIPRLELVARFDQSLLRRVDQALGAAEEVFESNLPPKPIIAERIFDGAVTDMNGVLTACCALTGDLSAALSRVESGAMALELTLQRLDATPISFVIQLSRPSREARHLWSLLRPRIESSDMGFGIERISLAAWIVHRIPHRQHERWRDDQAHSDHSVDHVASELIDAMSHRLGMERTVRLNVAESHLPERTAVLTPAFNGRSVPREPASITVWERPSMLLREPERIDVIAMTPEGPPMVLRWRGSEHRIVASWGPQRIANEWWRDDHSESSPHRDYYKVQDERGRWLWVYRQTAGNGWFMHGAWT